MIAGQGHLLVITAFLACAGMKNLHSSVLFQNKAMVMSQVATPTGPWPLAADRSEGSVTLLTRVASPFKCRLLGGGTY